VAHLERQAEAAQVRAHRLPLVVTLVILALLVLAIVAGTHDGGAGPEFWLRLALSLGGYIAVTLWGVPRIGRWFFRARSDGESDFIFTLALLFTFAYLAHLADIEPIIGALLTGFALNRLVPEQSSLMTRLKLVGDSLFVPFFLLSVGMLVDVRAFADRDAWVVIAALVTATVGSKAFAAKVTQRLFGFRPEDGWVMFGLSVSHAAATMAIVLVGYESGLFDETVLNAVVVIIMVTCVVGPWTVERFGRRIALREEQRPYDARETPRRILIPISNPATEKGLLDLAMLLRGRDSVDPLHPLVVVQEEESDAEASVAAAERMLQQAVIYVAAADIPVVPLTRVDQNVAVGIARGIAETRSSTVVVGWDGGKLIPSIGIFGSVLDQLLERTKQCVVVAKLGHPLNVTKRLVLVLPPLAHRHPGFYEAARMAKEVASALSASLLVVHVRSGEEEGAAGALAAVKPDVATSEERVGGWGDLLAHLRERVEADDLVMVVSARTGTLSWHPKLERLPGQLAGLLPRSFLIVFPPEADTPRRDDSPAVGLPRGLSPERMVFDLPSMPFEMAIRTLLASGLKGGDTRRLDEIVTALAAGEMGFSSEVRPGVFVPHARVSGIEEPILFLGTSTEGIDFPRGREPARLILILLSPTDQPREHLRSLAEIAGLVSHEESLQELIGEYTGGRHG
jgi:mannitol/fructose-specific phosphotransferase system IIA component (Ntr-type)